MISYSEAVKKLCQIETEIGIYDECLKGLNVPIWRIVRWPYRGKFVIKETGVRAINNHPRLVLYNHIFAYFKSFIQVLRIVFSKIECKNLIYGFARKEFINGKYIDKFSDPLIQFSSLGDSYIYFERGRSGVHKEPRPIGNILWTEFIDYTAIFLAVFYAPFLFLKNIKAYRNLFKKGALVFGFSKKDKANIVFTSAVFMITVSFVCIIMKILKVKHVFAPALGNAFEYVVSSRKNGVPCFEIQHGITTDVTVTYSGLYEPRWAPDLFFAFGESSLTGYFGVPVEKVLNIGYAFKKYLINLNVTVEENSFLFLSDPEITERIIPFAIKIAKAFQSCTFSFRAHPQEILTDSQKNELKEGGIRLIGSEENSYVCVKRYCGVIGVNTTVLYEALSVGVKAACISIGGLEPEQFPNPISREHIFVLNSIESFARFVSNTEVQPSIKEYYFSDFKKNVFENIISDEKYNN